MAESMEFKKGVLEPMSKEHPQYGRIRKVFLAYIHNPRSIFPHMTSSSCCLTCLYKNVFVRRCTIMQNSNRATSKYTKTW